MRDFGLLTAVEGTKSLDFAFPYDPDIVAFMKEMKAKWNPDRKCWTLPFGNKEDAQRILTSVAERLLDKAPDSWRSRFALIQQLGCVTKGYEIFVGEAGVRLKVPKSHPCEYYLKEKDQDILFHRGLFYLKPESAMKSDIVSIIKRIMSEDLKRYRSVMGDAVGSMLSGEIKNVSTEDLKGRPYIYVSRKFLDVVDPHFAKSSIPLSVIAFKISQYHEKEADVASLNIEYPPIEEGYKALQSYYKNPGLRVFTDEDVSGNWVLKSQMW